MTILDKLTTDAKLARVLAEAADRATADEGTCNLDATFFQLAKGERAEPIVRALSGAGLRAYPSRWIGRGLIVAPPTSGQANKRYAANQTLCESLRRAGWPVLAYSQMD
jgi:hypothetical protein